MAWWTHLALITIAITVILTLPWVFLGYAISFIDSPSGGVLRCLHPWLGFVLVILGGGAIILAHEFIGDRGWRKLKPSGMTWDVEKYVAETKARIERATMKEEQIRRQHGA